MNLNGMFSGGLTHVPGLGYVQSGSAGLGALGDDASVMMISGLGSSATIPGLTVDRGHRDAQGNWVPNIQADPNARIGTNYADRATPGAPGIKQQSMSAPSASQLAQPITIFNVTLPLWAWLSLAALLGGAGGYYLGRR